MESHFATEAVAQLRRRSLRAAAVNLIGPLTMLGGVAWAFLQPYRLTVLHPHGQGFWWLLSEPPDDGRAPSAPPVRAGLRKPPASRLRIARARRPLAGSS